jgi:hypothetical protein
MKIFKRSLFFGAALFLNVSVHAEIIPSCEKGKILSIDDDLIVLGVMSDKNNLYEFVGSNPLSKDEFTRLFYQEKPSLIADPTARGLACVWGERNSPGSPIVGINLKNKGFKFKSCKVENDAFNCI